MPGWLTDHFSLWLSGTLTLRLERQSARTSKTKNGRLTSLALNLLVTVPILELWAKWVNIDRRRLQADLWRYRSVYGSYVESLKWMCDKHIMFMRVLCFLVIWSYLLCCTSFSLLSRSSSLSGMCVYVYSDNFLTRWPLTNIFGMMILLSTIQVVFKGQSHR